MQARNIRDYTSRLVAIIIQLQTWQRRGTEFLPSYDTVPVKAYLLTIVGSLPGVFNNYCSTSKLKNIVLKYLRISKRHI